MGSAALTAFLLCTIYHIPNNSVIRMSFRGWLCQKLHSKLWLATKKPIMMHKSAYKNPRGESMGSSWVSRQALSDEIKAKPRKLFVGGAWVESGSNDAIPVVDPAT